MMLSALKRRAAVTVAVVVVALAATAPASAVTTAAVVHVASGAADVAAPSSVAVPRETELEIVNSPSNPGSYTYIVSDGDNTFSTPGAIAPGSRGRIFIPDWASPGTYGLTYSTGGVIGSVRVL